MLQEATAPGQPVSGRERVVERTSSLLQNTALSDVTFLVGPPSAARRYVGHRVLLAMTSPVFEAMFFGDMADRSRVVRLPDISPVAFENLLRFLLSFYSLVELYLFSVFWLRSMEPYNLWLTAIQSVNITKMTG
ncbi:hypothetical protein LAZ67_12001280 [Cordylochernes scorpioides]|uniref:BTB domain-containing protein n=1 Tax=Cordylochernes scorpioides TaxID=51811 RepID=A0ABY6L139_9ARAC|nr:hypothetical protein LAZ67_12001280 [Cordylochernes scorpioides]